MKKLFYFLLFTCITASLSASDCDADFEFTVTDATVTFNNLSTADPGPILGYLWDFGDGTTSTEINPTHTYAASGDYDVCLVIIADGGCTSERCDHVDVVVTGDCTVSFEYTGDPEVHFTAVTDPVFVTAYLWNFGDGTFSEAENPNHYYTSPGTYTVCLTVLYATGCTVTYCSEIIIAGGADCTANFEIISIDGANVHFVGTVSPAADMVTYTWIFGDGGSFTETTAGTPSDPTHMYPIPGVYYVCLTIETGDGCVDEYCSEVAITYVGCFSDFEFNIDGLVVNYYEAATGEVIAYNWDFGDGTTSDAANPSHTFAGPGSYIVCLTIETATGCTDTHCDSITIIPGGGDCESDFEFTASGLDAHFYQTADGAGAEIISYTWDFGDGGTATGIDPMHSYAASGTYLVCLTIVTADGCTSTYCDEIDVEDGGAGDCEALFSIASLEFTPEGWTLDLTNESTATGDITSVIWYFGDGTIGESYDAEHVYLEAGYYLICVVITTSDGCTSEYCDEIFIGADGGSCESDFEWTTDGLTVEVTQTADGGGSEIIGYNWTFGDGTTATGETATHTYTDDGGYLVCLTIVTADSCISTHYEEIHIEYPDAGCIAGFELESLTASPDGWVAVFNNTSDGTDNFYWTFGDGGTSDATDPDHLFTEPGIYEICLTVGEEGTDCYDMICQEIFIGDGDDCIHEDMIDPETDCPAVYEPVCGCDGNTYENACVAQYHYGILYFTEGECSLFLTIEEENIVGAIQLSPNPAVNQVNIQYAIKESSDVSIYIMDATGRQINEVFHEPSSPGVYHYALNTSELTAGIYLIRIIANDQQYIQKLVVAK